MGTVYAARHLLTREIVAVKLIPMRGGDLGMVLQRFRREVSVAARIRHPGVVRVQDAGHASDTELYLVMELLTGRDLEAELNEPEPNLHRRLLYFRQALKPLAAAHRAGIVHRDLKPPNIYLHNVAGQIEVKLLDFGIAKQTSEIDGGTHTDTSLGTPKYMSPEQAVQARAVGPASDVWSMGVILYRILYQRLPFEGRTPYTTLQAVCESTIHTPPLAEPFANRLLPVVVKCLEKRPRARPQDAGELADLIDTALLTPAMPTVPRPSTRPPRTPFAGAIAVILSVFVTGILWALNPKRPRGHAPASIVGAPSPGPTRSIENTPSQRPALPTSRTTTLELEEPIRRPVSIDFPKDRKAAKSRLRSGTTERPEPRVEGKRKPGPKPRRAKRFGPSPNETSGKRRAAASTDVPSHDPVEHPPAPSDAGTLENPSASLDAGPSKEPFDGGTDRGPSDLDTVENATPRALRSSPDAEPSPSYGGQRRAPQRPPHSPTDAGVPVTPRDAGRSPTRPKFLSF